jgi:hypothetical protein
MVAPAILPRSAWRVDGWISALRKKSGMTWKIALLGFPAALVALPFSHKVAGALLVAAVLLLFVGLAWHSPEQTRR